MNKENFLDILNLYDQFNFEEFFDNIGDGDIKKVLSKNILNEMDFLVLLSKKAQNYLEEMAKIAQKNYIRHFGRTISLYIPIYISNYCTSECLYCGFSKKNKITRKQLTLKEIEKETKEIAKSGIKHILLLTGEARKKVDLNYLIDAVKILKRYFSSVAIEVYPMDLDSYKVLNQNGVDTLTVYQETYDRLTYKQVHLSGEKRNFVYRLLTPERGAKAGFRAINIGSLFGLSDIQKEAFFSGIHADYLCKRYPECEFSLSLPRINKAEGGYKAKYTLDDKTFVQIMLAYRIFIPQIGINISTRERASFRDNLIGLGVTKMSAGSKTDVGGYALSKSSTAQFEISDQRDAKEIVKAIKSRGYQPIFKDWEMI